MINMIVYINCAVLFDVFEGAVGGRVQCESVDTFASLR